MGSGLKKLKCGGCASCRGKKKKTDDGDSPYNIRRYSAPIFETEVVFFEFVEPAYLIILHVFFQEKFFKLLK